MNFHDFVNHIFPDDPDYQTFLNFLQHEAEIIIYQNRSRFLAQFIDDIVQDSYLKIREKVGSFELVGLASPQTWVSNQVQQVVWSYRRKIVQQEIRETAYTDQAFTLPPTGYLFGESEQENSWYESLQEFLQSHLTEEEQKYIHERFVHNKMPKTIAEEWNCDVTYLYRLRDRVRDCILPKIQSRLLQCSNLPDEFLTEADLTYQHDAFLNYSSVDERKVTQLATSLQQRGLSIWFAPWFLGSASARLQPRMIIDSALQSSRNLLFCLSPTACNEDWRELDRNTQLFRKSSDSPRSLFTVMVEDCPLPSSLRKYRYFDYQNPTRNIVDEIIHVCSQGNDSNDGD